MNDDSAVISNWSRTSECKKDTRQRNAKDQPFSRKQSPDIYFRRAILHWKQTQAMTTRIIGGFLLAPVKFRGYEMAHLPLQHCELDSSTGSKIDQGTP